MKINPNKVIEDRLAASFGLEQYGYIISQWKIVDMSTDEVFKQNLTDIIVSEKTLNGGSAIMRYSSVGNLRSYLSLIEGSDYFVA